MIIGFLRSPRWKTPIMSFIDEYCTVFDDEDENKLEFTKIHNVSLKLAGLTRTLYFIGLQKDSRGSLSRADERVGHKR